MKVSKGCSLILLIMVVLLSSCKDTLPKPSAYLRLSYPQPNYKKYENCYYDLEVNDKAEVIQKRKCMVCCIV